VDRNLAAIAAIAVAAVAPRAGAWIETENWKALETTIESLPARERGSKLAHWVWVQSIRRRSPRGSVDRNNGRVRDIFLRACRSPRGSVDRNAHDAADARERAESLPARERGSKRYQHGDDRKADGRSPRGSVDRNSYHRSCVVRSVVAPRAGAWIETCQDASLRSSSKGRSPRGSVDRNRV